MLCEIVAMKSEVAGEFEALALFKALLRWRWLNEE